LEQDFERLYRRHAEDVFRYAILVLRSRTDAEDVTQATFIRAYRAIQRGERVRKPQHWLIKIAHRECLRHLRTNSRRALEVELDPAIADVHEPDEGPTAEEIRVALNQLSFNQRAALVMRELEDRSYSEIADVLGVSVSAVETLLFRARRALREQMEGAVRCGEVEELLLKQMDGALAPDEQKRLRAHTRSCAECRTLERQHRGRRAALKRLGSAITLPSQLGSFFGGGGGAVATATVALGAKAAAIVVAALAVTATGVAEVKRLESVPERSAVRGLPIPDPVAALAFPGWKTERGAAALGGFAGNTAGGGVAAARPSGRDRVERPDPILATPSTDADGGHAPAAAATEAPAAASTKPAAAAASSPVAAAQQVTTTTAGVAAPVQKAVSDALSKPPLPAPTAPLPSVTAPAAPVPAPTTPAVTVPTVTAPAVPPPPPPPPTPTVTTPTLPTATLPTPPPPPALP
jgi:RNA polymerase sigma factor (sigma-70 family)